MCASKSYFIFDWRWVMWNVHQELCNVWHKYKTFALNITEVTAAQISFQISKWKSQKTTVIPAHEMSMHHYSSWYFLVTSLKVDAKNVISKGARNCQVWPKQQIFKRVFSFTLLKNFMYPFSCPWHNFSVRGRKNLDDPFIFVRPSGWQVWISWHTGVKLINEFDKMPC